MHPQPLARVERIRVLSDEHEPHSFEANHIDVERCGVSRKSGVLGEAEPAEPAEPAEAVGKSLGETSPPGESMTPARPSP